MAAPLAPTYGITPQRSYCRCAVGAVGAPVTAGAPPLLLSPTHLVRTLQVGDAQRWLISPRKHYAVACPSDELSEAQALAWGAMRVPRRHALSRPLTPPDAP